MGVYQYTLRKETKVVDGIKIGRYGYACKHTYFRHSNHDRYAKMYNRLVGSVEAAADRAFEANADLEYAAIGEWKFASDPDGLAVIKVNTPSFADDTARNEIVGYLKKEGRKFKFIKK